jgi:outer membrane protein TolC
MLGVGYARRRTPMETMPMYEVMLEQALPRWGERAAARAQAGAATRFAEADLVATIGDVAGAVAMALAELEALAAQVRETTAEEARISAMTTALDARIASGDAGILERLALDTRRERLRLRHDDLQRQQADRTNEIRARLGLATSAVLPAFGAPLLTDIDPARTPAMLAADAGLLAALADLHEARAMGRPETAIGLRAEREAADDGNEDTIGVTVSISLPLARGAIAANEDAAHSRLRAAERQAEAARHRTVAAVEAARRALGQAERAERLANALLARAAQEQRALTAALATGGADLTAMLDLHDRLAELRLGVIDAQTHARLAQAALWSHVLVQLPTAGAGATP